MIVKLKATLILFSIFLFGCFDEGKIDKKIGEQIPVVVDECKRTCIEIIENDFPSIVEDAKQEFVDDLIVEIENRFYDYLWDEFDVQCLTLEEIQCIINETQAIFQGRADPGQFNCF